LGRPLEVVSLFVTPFAIAVSLSALEPLVRPLLTGSLAAALPVAAMLAITVPLASMVCPAAMGPIMTLVFRAALALPALRVLPHRGALRVSG